MELKNYENIVILEEKPKHEPVFVYKGKGHFIIDIGQEIEVCPFRNVDFIVKSLERNEIVFVLIEKGEVVESYLIKLTDELRNFLEKAIQERAEGCKYCSDEI